MGNLIMTGQVLLALSILIVLHEWGHFIMARMFGIKVEKFYLFFDAFGVKLFSMKRGETEYGIGWLPLGGYVKISGMIDESMDTEQMKRPPESWEFRSKPAFQRFLVMIGGVTVNFILGLIITIGIFWYFGEQFTPLNSIKHGFAFSPAAHEIGFKEGDFIKNVNGKNIKYVEEIFTPELLIQNGNYITVLRDQQDVKVPIPDNLLDLIAESKSTTPFIAPVIKGYKIDEVVKGSEAEAGGIHEDDRILSVNGKDAQIYNYFKQELSLHKGTSVTMDVLRMGDTIHLKVPVSESGTVGIIAEFDEIPQNEIVRYSLLESVPRGISNGWNQLTTQISAFGKIFRGEVKVTNALQGPIGIAKAFGSVWDWQRFWNLTALLSLVLAFMNLLPIPALDGGHVMLIAIEKLRGKPLGEKALERVQMVGMFLIIGLMIFIFGNDILRLINH